MNIQEIEKLRPIVTINNKPMKEWFTVKSTSTYCTITSNLSVTGVKSPYHYDNTIVGYYSEEEATRLFTKWYNATTKILSKYKELSKSIKLYILDKMIESIKYHNSGFICYIYRDIMDISNEDMVYHSEVDIMHINFPELYNMIKNEGIKLDSSFNINNNEAWDLYHITYNIRIKEKRIVESNFRITKLYKLKEEINNEK